MEKKIKIILFFNGLRGLKIYKFLKKKKDIEILKIFISKKFLDKKILNQNTNFKLIKNLNNNEIKKALMNCDVAIVGGFPLIFNKKLIKLPKFGIINCHAGPLPKYRGGSPLNWQIINNEKYFGITTIKMNSKIDGGDIINKMMFYLKKNYMISDLHRIVNKEFPRIVYDSILQIISKKVLKKQSKLSSYYPQRTNDDSMIFFKNKTLKEIKNFVRALQKPYPNPFFYFNNKKVSFHKFQISNSKLKKGSMIFKNNHFLLGCKDCTIKIKN